MFELLSTSLIYILIIYYLYIKFNIIYYKTSLSTLSTYNMRYPHIWYYILVSPQNEIAFYYIDFEYYLS